MFDCVHNKWIRIKKIELNVSLTDSLSNEIC
jgi:hypothetical protein